MTPAERVILRVLAEEYRRPSADRQPGGLGQYGRTRVRCGTTAYRVAEIERHHVPWAHCDRALAEDWTPAQQAAAIEARLA